MILRFSGWYFKSVVPGEQEWKGTAGVNRTLRPRVRAQAVKKRLIEIPRMV